MDHVIAAELVWAVASGGHSTLRFNYRGVGASQGTRGGQAEDLLEDAEAALMVARENARTEAVAVATLHGGAGVALALQERHPELAGVCLISPVSLDPSELARLRCPLLVVVGEEDRRLPRTQLLQAVQAAEGELELLGGAGPQLQRDLPLVGRRVRSWIERLSGG